MISTVQPLPIGNALRVFLDPPGNAVHWKVLRKGSDTFSGLEDASAFLAYEGDERVFVDSAHLQNGVAAYYRPYWYTGSGWVEGRTAHGTPAATYEDASTDVPVFLRERLEAGLRVEVERGTFFHDLGYIQVFTASPSLERDLQFPLVTVHLDSEEPAVRALGEEIGSEDLLDLGGGLSASDGWLASVRVSLIGWSLNSDERAELRAALRRVIIGNLPVFADRGWQQIELSVQDVDAVSGEYNAPLYQVFATFSCLAPQRVISRQDTISNINVITRSTG
jgi:hypothetical protein